MGHMSCIWWLLRWYWSRSQTLAVSPTHNFVGIFCTPSAISLLSPGAFHVVGIEASPYLGWPCSHPSPIMPCVITPAPWAFGNQYCINVWVSTDLWQCLGVSCFPFVSGYSLHVSFLFVTPGCWASSHWAPFATGALLSLAPWVVLVRSPFISFNVELRSSFPCTSLLI